MRGGHTDPGDTGTPLSGDTLNVKVCKGKFIYSSESHVMVS